jgi:dienelactone hydrolase/glutamine amidotransferase-like uncharacterized protein
MREMHSVVSVFCSRCMVSILLVMMCSAFTACRSSTVSHKGSPLPQPRSRADLGKFKLEGDPASPNGATWMYESHDDDIDYKLSGVLFKPQGKGPFPAVLISHGQGLTANFNSAKTASEMVKWGLVCIAPNYTFAGGGKGEGAPGTADKNRCNPVDNLKRAHKCLDILAALGYVDMDRVVVHGHSMGAFLTVAIAGAFPDEIRAASHTAGGEQPYNREYSLHVRSPYSIHHGSADTNVRLACDERFEATLTRNRVEHEMHVYPGLTHSKTAMDGTVLERVKAWYAKQGIFDGERGASPNGSRQENPEPGAQERPSATAVTARRSNGTRRSPIRVACLDVYGQAENGIGPKNIRRCLGASPEFIFQTVNADDIRGNGLSGFDVLICPGGSALRQSKTLDAQGRQAVLGFVRNGGGYIGICAGAYLASIQYEWSLGILNAKVADPTYWARGTGDVTLKMTAEGCRVLGANDEIVTCFYGQGPLFAPGDRTDLPVYEVLATYDSEIAKKNVPSGVMVGTTAIAAGTCGKGRVLCFSPHPEKTKGLEDFVSRAVRWAAGSDSACSGRGAAAPTSS